MNRRKLLLANNPLLSGPSLKEREKGFSPFRTIPLELLSPDENQPRREFDETRLAELSESVRLYGVLNPVLVRPDASGPGRFIIIAGERRFRAAQLAGLRVIPAIVSQDQGLPEESRDRLAIQLVENLQRENLAPLDRAQGIAALKDGYDMSVRDIAKHLGISKSAVQRSLELLNLPDDLVEALEQGVSESKVLALAQIEDRQLRASLLQNIDSIPRKDLEIEVAEKKKERSKDRAVRESEGNSLTDAEDRRLGEEIQRTLGLKVRVARTSAFSQSGKLVIDFYSEEDLQEIFRRLVDDACHA